MWAEIFFLTTVISVVGWLTYWTATSALIWYMIDKGYTPPSGEETKAYCSRVLKKMLHIH